jgi:hypothetical protein
VTETPLVPDRILALIEAGRARATRPDRRPVL